MRNRNRKNPRFHDPLDLPLTVRFWHYYHGSWVKLTLREGEEIKFGYSRPDDEGYHFEASKFHLDIDSDPGRPFVVEEWINGGRDCDGRIEHSGVSSCPVTELAAVESYAEESGYADLREWQRDWMHEGKRIMRPAWKEYAPVRVFDEYAQATGY